MLESKQSEEVKLIFSEKETVLSTNKSYTASFLNETLLDFLTSSDNQTLQVPQIKSTVFLQKNIDGSVSVLFFPTVSSDSPFYFVIKARDVNSLKKNLRGTVCGEEYIQVDKSLTIRQPIIPTRVNKEVPYTLL